MKRLLFAALLYSTTTPGLVWSQQQNGCEKISEALEQASNLRSLKLLHTVPCISATRTQFRKLQQEHVQSLTKNRDLKEEGTLYRLIGLIPDTFDYSRCVIEGSEEYIQAFYHSQRHAIVVPDWQPMSFDILVHESVHALQDQHFDLNKMAKKALVSTDRALAFAALIEGDAKIIQAHIPSSSREETQKPLQPKPCDLPSGILDQDYFPYTFGRLFVERLINQSGYKAVNEAFRDPPSTTTEIIHRDKYPRSPVKSNLYKVSETLRQKVKVKGLQQVHNDTLGQYTIRVVLGQALDMRNAVLASKGWVADNAVLLSNNHKNQNMLSWQTEWETESDAQEFFAGFIKVLEKRYEISIQSAVKSIFVQPTTQLQILLTRNGNRVHCEFDENIL